MWVNEMKLLERNYLTKIINVIGTPDIKVITGIRRSGKSCLLLQFMEYINQTDKDANIISYYRTRSYSSNNSSFLFYL